MTAFEDQLAADAAAVFLNPAEFARAVTLRFADAAPVSARAIKIAGDSLEPNAFGSNQAAVCRWRLAMADLATIDALETIVEADGTEWRVTHAVSSDSAMVLVEATRSERAGLKR